MPYIVHDSKDSNLLDWYNRLTNRRVDLVGDYAGNELFLVEGDSLLLRCFDNVQLDFDGGFQILHAVYAVEHFLQNLAQRKCNYNVVFFESHSQLCIPRGTSANNKPKYLLARSIVKRHLSANLQRTNLSIDIRSFKNVQDANFIEYLRATGVYFVMSHDGANPIPLSISASDDEAVKMEKDRIEAEETTRKVMLRSMIGALISHGYNVALINGLEWQDTKVMTLVVEKHDRARSQFHVEEPELEDSESENLDGSISSDKGDPNEQSVSELTLLDGELLEGLQPLNDILSSVPQTCKCASAQTAHSYQGLSERVYLTIATLGHILTLSPELRTVAADFLLHTALLRDIPIRHRRCPPVNQEAENYLETVNFLIKFSETSTSLLQKKTFSDLMNKHTASCDLADLVDGRLLYFIRAHVLPISTSLKTSFDEMAALVCIMSGVHLSMSDEETGKKSCTSRTSNAHHEETAILPFANPVFDKHLTSINIKVSTKKETVPQTARIFKEVSHWHNAKRRLDLKVIAPMSARDKVRASRRNDFFMAEMQSYAASLTNSTGKSLEPEIITLTGKAVVRPEYMKENDSSKEANSKQSGGAKAVQKGKGASKKQAMLDGIAASKAVKDNDNVSKVFSTWQTVRKNLDAERSRRAKYLKMKAYLRDLPDQKRKILNVEVEFHLLSILVEMYGDLRKGPESRTAAHAPEMFGIAALLWDTCRRLAANDDLTKTIADRLKFIIKALHLPTIGNPNPTRDRALACDPNLWLPKGSEASVGVDSQDFQLVHCGPYMDRNLDSAPDSRVPFEPDAWQRAVLDELDAERSVFVVAPTSAGKTFISFYAMEKILRANDESVLVYVAPTKALVNQIAAEIQARFRKTYKHAGKSVWAIHTRDYRINSPTGCQILVTVPHILQIMLLAPSNAKSWSSRVKYIIFDEIHSIGQAEDGVVWEQLLLLAPCPIIALSATVGNPEQFSSWLTATQETSGQRLTMIQHKVRYSDLRKFVYNAPKAFLFQGLADRPTFGTLGLDHIKGLSFIHPIASLVNKSRGIPDDLSLEARDCLYLYQAMNRHQSKTYPITASLGPPQSASTSVIRKADVLAWESNLKATLKVWMKDENSPFDQLREDLSKSMDENCTDEIEVSKGNLAELNSEDLTKIDPDNLYDTTLPLLCKLHERDALPAIFFNYDRTKCEGICQSIVANLEAAEARYKESSQAWKTKLSGFEQWKRNQSKAAAKKPVKAASKKKTNDPDDDGSSKLDRLQDAGDDINPYIGFDPLDPVDGYHFAVKHKAEASELSKYFYQITRRGLPSWLIDGLKRGVGVHHAGMNRKYRQVVEMLFRKGYLRVVIATGTLALGINMPCATVVFSGDSVFLTALNYRQAAGRAGRRGFDLLGNVVFQGISHGKICRLLSSRLPDLNGHFPVTTTLVLRLFSLLHDSGNSTYATKAIDSILSQPRLYLDGPSFKDQVLHHLRFSIEYLRRQDLLSSQGAPINFAGLTSHLYYTENSSFALNALIKEGYMHELCADIVTKESQADAEYIENTVKRSPSIVFLPPLPSDAARVLKKHNADTLSVFTTYVGTFIDQHIDTEDSILPLTGFHFGGSNKDLEVPGALPATKIRSAFVALSGHDDQFATISDLCRTSRGGVFLEEAVIPHVDVYPEETKTPLNAYLYDFFMHGDVHALEKANKVKKADVWFVLNDFSMVLATIVASLANFMKLPDSDVSMEDIAGEGDDQENLEDDKLATDSAAGSDATSVSGNTAITAASSVSAASKTAKPKTKKITEDWDDALAADEEKENDAANQIIDDDTSKEDLERGFLNVYRAFTKLRTEFDTKFRKIFA